MNVHRVIEPAKMSSLVGSRSMVFSTNVTGLESTGTVEPEKIRYFMI